MWAGEPGYSFQSSLPLTCLKAAGRTAEFLGHTSCFSLTSPYLALLPATSSPQPLTEYLQSNSQDNKGFSEGSGPDEIEPMWSYSFSPLPSSHSPQSEVLGTVCSSRASCSRERETTADLPSLKRTMVLKAPRWKSPQIQQGRKEGGRSQVEACKHL